MAGIRSDAAVARVGAYEMRRRAVGVTVGTLIGAGWLGAGLSVWPSTIVRVMVGLIGLGVVVALLRAVRAMRARARALPAGGGSSDAARRARMLFWINFGVEIVLLNVAVNLLSASALRIYWIPAISLVVGLHFLPMARFLAVPSYWITGLAFIAGAAIVAAVVHAGVDAPALWVGAEAIGNACILWSTAAWGLRQRR